MAVEYTTTPAIASTTFATASARVLVAWGSYDDAGLVLKPIPVGSLDTVRTCTNRIWKQLERRPGGEDFWGDLFTIVGKAVEPIEDALWRINEGRSANTAVGEQLDGVGSLVELERGGLIDQVYRGAIIVTGVGLFGGGTREDMNAGGRGLWGDRYVGCPEIWPGKQQVIVNDLTADELALAVVVLGELRSAGVGSVIEVSSTTAMGGFDYDDDVDAFGVAGYDAGGPVDDAIEQPSFVSYSVAF